MRLYTIKTAFLILALGSACLAQGSITLTGEVVDAGTSKAIPCRIYIQADDGTSHFVKSASPEGSAVIYDKQNWSNKQSVERHTTISAHPFTVDLPPGQYTVTVEHGKEYFTSTQKVNLLDKPVKLAIPLKRWINLAELGWYSGDTHVHRTLEELPNVQLAEDLNVSFPLLNWVTKAFASPSTGDKSTQQAINPELVQIDETHVIYPLNTEYEIFTVNDKSHTLGAIFILNHKTPFQVGVPPVAPIAALARQQGALLELDKHNWPWSMMLVPVMNVDLFELTNNHIWQTEFAFRDFGEKPAKYMNIQTDEKGFTEWGWINFGFENYYALLNSGFPMRPTAGTASGVHPVQLGFGRVYVKLKDRFDYNEWIKGLNNGTSFITTGPMLFATLNDQDQSHRFTQTEKEPKPCAIKGHAHSDHPLDRIEIIVNGQIAKTIKPENKKTKAGACISIIDQKLDIDSSSWIAIRCFEIEPDKRIRFAHTGAFYIDVEGKPLRPRKEQIRYLIERIEAQIKRNADSLPKEAIDEYNKALEKYKAIEKTAI